MLPNSKKITMITVYHVHAIFSIDSMEIEADSPSHLLISVYDERNVRKIYTISLQKRFRFRRYSTPYELCIENFHMLSSFATMDELLDYSGIGGQKFLRIIIDDSTQILGKD